jgi:hypothetical protein
MITQGSNSTVCSFDLRKEKAWVGDLHVVFSQWELCSHCGLSFLADLTGERGQAEQSKEIGLPY